MRILFLTALLLSISCIGFAQHRGAKPIEGQQSFYAELGGPGILFSANYDRRFAKSRLGWGFRAGVGFVTTDEYYYRGNGGLYDYRRFSVVTIPLQINHIFGKENSPHSFEAGAGLTVASKDVDVFNNGYRNQLYGTFSFMYRRQPVNGGFSWRIGFTPIITGDFIQASGGVSVGYNF